MKQSLVSFDYNASSELVEGALDQFRRSTLLESLYPRAGSRFLIHGLDAIKFGSLVASLPRGSVRFGLGMSEIFLVGAKPMVRVEKRGGMVVVLGPSPTWPLSLVKNIVAGLGASFSSACWAVSKKGEVGLGVFPKNSQWVLSSSPSVFDFPPLPLDVSFVSGVGFSFKGGVGFSSGLELSLEELCDEVKGWAAKNSEARGWEVLERKTDQGTTKSFVRPPAVPSPPSSSNVDFPPLPPSTVGKEKEGEKGGGVGVLKSICSRMLMERTKVLSLGAMQSFSLARIC